MDVTPAVQNLTIQKGDTFRFEFDIDVDGSILDLSTAVVLAQIRTGMSQTSTLIIDFTVDVSVDNVVTISLDHTETGSITHNSGFWDVLVIIGDDRTHYIQGSVTFTGTVTIEEEPAP